MSSFGRIHQNLEKIIHNKNTSIRHEIIPITLYFSLLLFIPLLNIICESK